MKFKIKFVLLLFVFFESALSLGQTPANINLPADRQEVYDHDFFRNTFYTWTTEEQIKELRENKTLLTKSKSRKKGYSLFDISYRSPSSVNDPLIQLLQEEQFEKKRFAWTSGWATVMGWEGEKYGDQLIKIVINDSAIIGKFEAYNYNEPVIFFDMDGKKLSTGYVLEHKNRIAVVYHLNMVKGRRKVWWYTFPNGTFAKAKMKEKRIVDDVPFREFVILNEKMIKSWSYGTSEIKKEIESEIALLNQFKLDKDARQESNTTIQSVWSYLNAGDTVNIKKYYALACFENDYYLYNAKRLQAISDRLQVVLNKQSAEIVK